MIKFVLLKTVIQRLNKIINWQFFEFWTMQIGLPVERKYKEQFLLGSLRKQSSIECRFLVFYFLFLYSLDFDRGLLLEYHLLKSLKSIFTLRVVKTQAILCLISSTQNRLKITSFTVVLCRIRLFPRLISKMARVWTTLFLSW